VADPETLTDVQRERWVLDITSWDLCDSAADLFGRTPAQADAIKSWARRPEPFVKRCAFSMMARRAVWAKQAPDREFLGYLPSIRRASTDPRNEVKKGVSWALRQIGKRNRSLHAAAVDEAERILLLATPSARWIARDALRELESETTRSRLPD
jgi:3-methyladenine DNA glycosylase AlkD